MSGDAETQSHNSEAMSRGGRGGARGGRAQRARQLPIPTSDTDAVVSFINSLQRGNDAQIELLKAEIASIRDEVRKFRQEPNTQLAISTLQSEMEDLREAIQNMAVLESQVQHLKIRMDTPQPPPNAYTQWDIKHLQDELNKLRASVPDVQAGMELVRTIEGSLSELAIKFHALDEAFKALATLVKNKH